MNHERMKEQIELLFYDELTGRDREEAEAHVQQCSECRVMLDDLKKLHGVLAQYSPAGLTDRLLQEARSELQSALLQKRLEPTLWERLHELFDPVMGSQVKLALGGVATIAVGFFFGYLAFKSPVPEVRQQQAIPVQQADKEERPMPAEGGQITNIKFIDSDAQDGNVEFTFDAIMPMHLRGSVTDPQIQQVLSYALLNAQNPGTRLRSVSAMASEETARTDEDVKNVLIAALRSDDNPGVRKEALSALQKFRFDYDIKRAYMDALAHDSNSAIRIDAINALKAASLKDIAADQDLLNIFKERVKSDDNSYVRLRAKAVLQEINQ
jgi:hypothetical protein